MDDIYTNLIAKLRESFSEDSSGHDITHLVRVLNIAGHIQEKEGGNRRVIMISALLHDIHRLIQKESGSFCSPKDSLVRVEQILDEIGIGGLESEQILHCIEFHEEYGFSENGKTVHDLETHIVQDADNLDAIGAVGIARTFMYGGASNLPMWAEEIPFDRDQYDDSEPDPSVIHHFYSKLLRLKDNMNTGTGHVMAQSRHEFMQQFLEQFFKEWKGDL